MAKVLPISRYIAVMISKEKQFLEAGSCRIGLCLILSMICTTVLLGQSKTEFSVGTYNVRYDNPEDTLVWQDRKVEVARAVGYFDLIAIQEALPNQYDDLKSNLHKHDSFGFGRDADGGGEACPVFWNRDRFDFLNGEVRWLSIEANAPGSIGWDADLPRICTIVVLFDRQRQQTIRVLNSHWSHVGSEARMNSAALIAGWSGWENDSDELVVVCGDFNAEPDSQEIENLKSSAELEDTYFQTKYRCRKDFGTFTSFLPENLANSKRIDYILFRGDVSVEWVCADEHIKYGVYISDHMPYHAVFK